MSATPMNRMMLLAVCLQPCGVSLALAIQHFRREPPVDTKAALAASAVSKPASDARDQDPAAVAAAQATTNAVAARAGPDRRYHRIAGERRAGIRHCPHQAPRARR